MFICRECGLDCPSNEFLARHIGKRHGSFRDYVLKWKYNGVRPLCKCGCGGEPNWNVRLRDFAQFVHGHHAFGHEVTEDMRRKIGEKNSANMTKFLAENPDVMMDRIENMQKYSFTDEANQNRSEAIKNFWKSAASADAHRRATEHTLNLLEQGLIGPQAPFKVENIFNPFTGREEFMHSGWESMFLRWMIENGLEITKSHGLIIPYLDEEGASRVYVPDFISRSRKQLIEVKGNETERDRLKCEAGRAWCAQNDHEFILLKGAHNFRSARKLHEYLCSIFSVAK